jgi:hypothetical protein
MLQWTYQGAEKAIFCNGLEGAYLRALTNPSQGAGERQIDRDATAVARIAIEFSRGQIE